VAIRRGHKNDEQRPEKVPAQAAGPKPAQQAGPKAQAQPAAAADAAAAVPAQPKVENTQDQIRRLATLRQLGVLNNQEFEDLTALLLDLPRA
jgi:hypothetical protein